MSRSSYLRSRERKLARQRKGSNRRNRTKASLARLRARDADRRRDWIEKVSTALVTEHDVNPAVNILAAGLAVAGRRGRPVGVASEASTTWRAVAA